MSESRQEMLCRIYGLHQEWQELMNEDVQRKDFELWLDYGENQHGMLDIDSESKKYIESKTENQWSAWKACAALKNKHILNGCAYGLNCDKVIEDLETEVERLRQGFKVEAEYCQGFADQYKGEDRGLRHQERADRILKYLEQKE